MQGLLGLKLSQNVALGLLLIELTVQGMELVEIQLLALDQLLDLLHRNSTILHSGVLRTGQYLLCPGISRSAF